MNRSRTSDRPRRLTYSNVLSTLTVFLALAGGTALAAGLPKNSVTSKTVKDGSLTGADLRDGSLGATDLADSSLTGADLADGSLGAAKLKDGSVGGPNFASGSIGAAAIGKGAVTAEKLAANAVRSANVLDGSLQGADVAGDTLTGRNIDESTLGRVLDSAALDGLPPSLFLLPPSIHQVSTGGQNNGEGELGQALGDGTFKISVACPAGFKLLTGGASKVNVGSSIVESFPKDDSWSVRINPHRTPDTDKFVVTAWCTTG